MTNPTPPSEEVDGAAPDLATLFYTDPLSLTRSDIDRIIAKMRENRSLFNSIGTPAKSVTRSKPSKLPEELKDMKLDLDL